MSNIVNRKPVVMHHCVRPNQIGGPNITMNNIINSELNQKYDFKILNQDKLAGGKISLSLINDLKNKINEENPDIVHISGLQSAGFHCLIAAKLSKCKRTVMTVHGFSGDSLNISKTKKFVFNNIIEPLTLKYANAVYCVCSYASNRTMIKKFAKNSKGYVYNAIPDLESINDSKNEIRKSLGIKEDDIVCITVSRVVKDKGYEYLAECINRFENNERIKFIIVGEGEYLEEFKCKVSTSLKYGKVLILGKRNDILKLMKGSDIFVFPTLHENLSNSLLEAAISKLAIICTNVGGNPEVIKNNITGILVNKESSDELIKAIYHLANDNDIRNELSNNCYNFVNQNFNKKVVYKKIDKIYEELLSN